MLVLNLPFKALMFLTLMRPSLVLFLVLWLKLVKDFLKVRCRLALLPFLISCLIWLDLVASLPLIPTSSTLYFDSLTVNAGNGGFLHCIQMDTSVNAANQVVSVGADIAFDADPKFFACLVRFESSSVPTTLPTAYDVYPLDGRH